MARGNSSGTARSARPAARVLLPRLNRADEVFHSSRYLGAMHTDWRAYVGRDGWRWRLARALTPRSRRVRRIRGVLLSGCAGYRVRPCADAALRGIESAAPTPEEINAARVWLSEIKFVEDLVGTWRRGTFSSAALVRLAQRTGLESAHEAAIRVIDRETRAPGGELFAVSPRTERLVLTEEAALVWSKSLPVLHEFWPDEANRPRWFMTGGAVLGARWGGHRQRPAHATRAGKATPIGPRS